ncbi:MAG: CxxC-x17-CxxC domain-containing protein [Candidatus Paceibacterota bacterium]
MGNFQGGGNRGGGFRGGNGGGGRPSFGGGNRGGDRGPVTMHKAVCDECHKSCEVPFRPSGDKPIYCNECFGSKRGNEAPRREFNNDRAPRREFNDRPAPSFSKPAPAPMGNDMSK